MKHILELNEQDIKEIIANRFSVLSKNVELEVKEECVGYGMGEHMEPVLVGRVIKEEKVENE